MHWWIVASVPSILSRKSFKSLTKKAGWGIPGKCACVKETHNIFEIQLFSQLDAMHLAIIVRLLSHERGHRNQNSTIRYPDLERQLFLLGGAADLEDSADSLQTQQPLQSTEKKPKMDLTAALSFYCGLDLKNAHTGKLNDASCLNVDTFTH